MEFVTLILDSRPAYLSGAPPNLSLLSLPVGTGTLLSVLAERICAVGVPRIRVLPMFPADPGYERFVLEGAPADTTVVGNDVLATLVQAYDSSDVLFVFDPRYWPADGLDAAAILRESRDKRWAVHGVAVDSAPEGTQEFVHCDDNGNVRRIGRYYDQVTCSRIGAVAYSLVPIASVEGLCFQSLVDMRAHLTARGLLSRDVPLAPTIIDLTEEHGFLALNEQQSVGAATRPSPGYSQDESGAIVGRGCRIHPSARIVPPVIIHREATIEEGATVVGPTVIGTRASVRRGALVAQSVLAGRTVVPPGEVVRHSVKSGKCHSPISALNARKLLIDKKLETARSQSIRLGADASVMRDVHRRRSIYPTVKLAADSAVAFASLVVLSPLFLLAAIIIKLDSRGPVFFGHEREGKSGKLFRCLKFRTMRRDAHQFQRELYATNTLDGPQFKLHNDPRVTRVGALLRATNIDELPQLINVLLGQMSLIGPRPSPFRENQICVPWRRARLSVRPGITGLWQICRDQRSEGDFHQWISYDIMYVRHLSLWLDLKILLATVLTLGGLWRVPHVWIVGADHVSPRRRPAGNARRPAAVPRTISGQARAVIHN